MAVFPNLTDLVVSFERCLDIKGLIILVKKEVQGTKKTSCGC